MDERQKNNLNSAMAKVLILVYVVVAAYGLLKFLQDFNIMDCILELIIAVAAPILVLIFSRNKRKKTTFPMTLAGLAIFPDRTKKAKIGRIKAYLLDSLIFSALMVVIRIIFTLWNRYCGGTLEFNFDRFADYGLQILSEFAMYFVVYLIMDYIIYEHKSKQYCKENDISER